jgi:hypothetical protein
VETISKIVGFLAVATGAVGALLQYGVNSAAEERQRGLAELEADIKISGVFSELAQTAAGYGQLSEPRQEIIQHTLNIIPNDLMVKILQSDPNNLGFLFSGAKIPSSVPLARQLAAAEAIATLAIKYPVLLEPALASLDVAVIVLPEAKHAYDRVCTHYGIQRPLNNWNRKTLRMPPDRTQPAPPGTSEL